MFFKNRWKYKFVVIYINNHIGNFSYRFKNKIFGDKILCSYITANNYDTTMTKTLYNCKVKSFFPLARNNKDINTTIYIINILRIKPSVINDIYRFFNPFIITIYMKLYIFFIGNLVKFKNSKYPLYFSNGPI